MSWCQTPIKTDCLIFIVYLGLANFVYTSLWMDEIYVSVMMELDEVIVRLLPKPVQNVVNFGEGSQPND